MRRYISLLLLVGLAWGQNCTADDGTDGVELWSTCYSIENTTELDLSGSWNNPGELTGSISPEIGNLTNLTSLFLNYNQLTGEIPLEIGNLTNLTDLDLGINQLTGEIPVELGNLTNLTYLYLGHNQFTGEIPSEIGNLTNLNRMFLNNNQLTGAIPSEIGNLTNLTYLYLGHNQLTGQVPESLCDLNIVWSNGNRFNITNNQLCPLYPSCIEDYVGEQDTSNCGECDENSEVVLWGQNYSVENTINLNLNNSGLTGPIPPEIGCLSNLRKLELQNNQLTGSIPSEIGNLTNLTRLWLYDNQLTGEIPDSICSLVENNCNINISNNQLCPPYPSCIEDYVGEQDTTNCGQVSIIDETFPITYNLYNAYPNPFNPVTTLRYDLPEDALVNITIYDMMGRIVNNLVSNQQNAGYKSIQWNATNNAGQPVSAGLYLYTIQAGEFVQTKKMVLLK
jgi:Leucine-rich repeat (LRR) protein